MLEGPLEKNIKVTLYGLFNREANTDIAGIAADTLKNLFKSKANKIDNAAKLISDMLEKGTLYENISYINPYLSRFDRTRIETRNAIMLLAASDNQDHKEMVIRAFEIPNVFESFSEPFGTSELRSYNSAPSRYKKILKFLENFTPEEQCHIICSGDNARVFSHNAFRSQPNAQRFMDLIRALPEEQQARLVKKANEEIVRNLLCFDEFHEEIYQIKERYRAKVIEASRSTYDV